MSSDRKLPELSELARSAERRARPLPPEQVRRLSTRRRQRRTALAVAAAVVTVGGGLGLSQLGSLRTEPVPVASPTASAASSAPSPTASAATSPEPSDPSPTSTDPPSRALTRANLLKPSDVPWPGEHLLEVTTAVGVGRPEQASACFPADGLAALGADQVLSRSYLFRRTGAEPEPPDPGEEPSIYSAALQFGEAAAAKDAYAQIVGWRSGCESRLYRRGFEPVSAGADESATPVEVKGRQRGEFTRVVYRPAGGEEEARIFESTGITRVGDRVMLTVTVTSGRDEYVTLDREEASATRPLHPQFALIRAAVERLEG